MTESAGTHTRRYRLVKKALFKRALGLFTTIVVALAVVGVAWATDDNSTSTSAQAGVSSTIKASSASSTSSTVAGSSTSSSTIDSSTSTTVGSSSSSIDDDSTTSTTVAGSTSSTIGDDGPVPDGVSVHAIPGVGLVTIEVSGGAFFLLDVSAPGWTIEKQRVERDRIRLELVKGEAEARFEASAHDGRLEVKTEVDSD